MTVINKPFNSADNVCNDCAARANHGCNGIERAVVDKITAWMLE